jgi:outer membrane protein
MRALIVLIVPFLLFAKGVGLKTFIKSANAHNEMIHAQNLSIESKSAELGAIKSGYMPTVDVGASYIYSSPKSMTLPQRVGRLFISTNFNLYDGGRKSALSRAKVYEKEAAEYAKEAYAKSIALQIVRHYYNIYIMQSTLNALYNREHELKAQIERLQKFIASGLATQEQLDKLRASYENNRYNIESAKLALFQAKENLKLVSKIKANKLRYMHFKDPKGLKFSYSEQVKKLLANAKALGANANALRAGYKPQLNLSHKYSKSDYKGVVSGADALLLDHQNQITLTASMRVFDGGKIGKDAEALKYKKMALLSQAAYVKREQKMNYKVAKESLRSTKAEIAIISEIPSIILSFASCEIFSINFALFT